MISPYDELAETYNERGDEYTPLLSLLLDIFILPSIPIHAKITDYGCGVGHMLAQIYQRNFRNIYGVDSSKEMILYAKINNENIDDNLLCCDMVDYSNNKSSHVGIFLAVIHLINPKDVISIFKTMINNIHCRVVITTREYSTYEYGWRFQEKDKTGVKRWKMHYTYDTFANLSNKIFSGSHMSYKVHKFKDHNNDPWLIVVGTSITGLSYLNDGYVKLDCDETFPINEMVEVYNKAITRNPNNNESYICFGCPENIVRVERFIPDTIHLKNWLKSFDFRPFIKSNPVLMKDKMNFKKPGEGTFPPHQDALAGWTSSDCLTIGIAIDNIDTNGCLEFVKGAHTKSHGEIQQTLPISWVDKQQWNKINMNKGDIIVFHGMSPHKSGKNNTDRIRRLVLITFGNSNDYEADYYNVFFENKIKKQPPIHHWDTSKTYTMNEFGKWMPDI